MMSLRMVTLFGLLLVGVQCQAGTAAEGSSDRPTMAAYKEQKANEAAANAAAATQKLKNAPIDKVVEMLEGLTKKVIAEGESEARSYNKFACFCKDTQAAQRKAISSEKDQTANLAGDIGVLSSGRESDDGDVETFEGDLETLHQSVKDKATEKATFIKEAARTRSELVSAIDGVSNALKTMRSKKPSLVQLSAAYDTVNEAMVMAAALGMKVNDKAQGQISAMLQQDQAPEAQMENFKFHSDGIISTLEGLLTKVRGDKVTADRAEVSGLHGFDLENQRLADEIKAKELELQEATRSAQQKTAEVARTNQALTLESATLSSDKVYLNDVLDMCQKKAETWDTRSQVRADELSAIASATTIVKGAVSEKTSRATLRFAQQGVTVRMAEAVARDESSMAAVEQEAEEAEAAPTRSLKFLQLRSVAKHLASAPIEQIAKLLREVGGKTKSATLVSLASQISAGPAFAKVKALLESLVARLQTEAAGEATQKGWCSKATSDAALKRSAAAASVEEINDQMARVEADREGLAQTLEALAKQIGDLGEAIKTANALRLKEGDENAAVILEAGEGLTAINGAISVLDTFYKKVNGTTTDEEPLEGEVDNFLQVKILQAPEVSFDADSPYIAAGSQKTAGGVLAMLDVIKSDFTRTVTLTEKAEAQSVEDHGTFVGQAGTTKAEQERIQTDRTTEKGTADSLHAKLVGDLDTAAGLLKGIITELIDLQKACVVPGMSFADRQAKRQEEIEALQKSLEILETELA